MTTFSELRQRLTAGKYQPNGTSALAVVILAELLDLLERERVATVEQFAQPLAPEAPRDAQPERLPDEPALPPGCRLDNRGPESWPWCVRGLDGGVVGSGRSPLGASMDAWKRFGAFMSREDYETLAAADLREEATAKRLDDALAAIRGAHLALDVAGTSSDGTLVERIGRLVCEHWRKLEAEHDATHAAGLRAERAEARAAADASVAVAHDALSEAGVERFTTALGQGGPSKRALTLIERVRLLSGKVSDAEAEVVRLRSEVADVRKDRDNACHRVDVLEDELREAHEARRSLAHVVDRQRAEARINRNDPDHD